MAKAPEEQREWFEKLLRATQMSGSWIEEHNYYLDMMGHAVACKLIWEIGRRFAQDRVIDDRFDIFMLMPWEIQKSLILKDRFDMRPIVRARREEWEKYLETEPPPPVLGQLDKFGEVAIKDAVIVGREAGIPAVAGTMEGTKRIKAGDRIKVDGDRTAVYILKK